MYFLSGRGALKDQELVSPLGPWTTTFPNIKLSPLYYIALDKCRISGLKKKSKGNFGSKVNLSKDALLDLLKQTRPGLHLEPKVLMRDCDSDIWALL